MFTVRELQNGNVGQNVWPYPTENEALSKYFLVLSYAAVSTVAHHAAVVLRDTGEVIASQCFEHTQEQEE